MPAVCPGCHCQLLLVRASRSAIKAVNCKCQCAAKQQDKRNMHATPHRAIHMTIPDVIVDKALLTLAEEEEAQASEA